MLGRRRLTWAEQWKRDALRDGWLEGVAIGESKGCRETHWATLQRLTHKRFGPEAAAVAAARLVRIEDLTRLEGLAEALLDCTSAEQWLALLTPDADAN